MLKGEPEPVWFWIETRPRPPRARPRGPPPPIPPAPGAGCSAWAGGAGSRSVGLPRARAATARRRPTVAAAGRAGPTVRVGLRRPRAHLPPRRARARSRSRTGLSLERRVRGTGGWWVRGVRQVRGEKGAGPGPRDPGRPGTGARAAETGRRGTGSPAREPTVEGDSVTLPIPGAGPRRGTLGPLGARIRVGELAQCPSSRGSGQRWALPCLHPSRPLLPVSFLCGGVDPALSSHCARPASPKRRGSHSGSWVQAPGPGAAPPPRCRPRRPPGC